MLLIASVIKRVPIVKENISPKFVKKTSKFLLTTNDNHVTYTLVIIDIEDIKCLPLIDTEAGASYASFILIDRMNKKSYQKTHRNAQK